MAARAAADNRAADRSQVAADRSREAADRSPGARRIPVGAGRTPVAAPEVVHDLAAVPEVVRTPGAVPEVVPEVVRNRVAADSYRDEGYRPTARSGCRGALGAGS